MGRCICLTDRGVALYKEATKFRFAGKVVLITGGSRGHWPGCWIIRVPKLAICARTAHQLVAAEAELSSSGIDVLPVMANLTERVHVQSVVDKVIERYGRIDVLINNAEIIHVGPKRNMCLKDYEDAMNVNLWAALYGMHAVIPFFY